MRILTVRVGGKTYTAAAITTGLAREALRCMDEIGELQKKTAALTYAAGAAEISAAVRARLRCSDRQTALLCRVFGDRFTADALEDSLTRPELDALTLSVAEAVADVAAFYASGSGAGGDQTALQAFDKLYHTLATNLRWPVSQIDNADFESLMSFVFYRDPDVRIIGGREYRRARGVPTWL